MRDLHHLIILIITFCGLNGTTFAQEYNLKDTSSIPLNGASAIVWLDSTAIELNDNNFVLKKKKVITVFNDTGNIYSLFSESYNSYSTISKMRASLLDKDGKEIQKVKSGAFGDVSAFGSSYAFYQDDRYKVFDFRHREYPYTVVFEFEKKYNSLFFLPNWFPQENLLIPVKRAVLGIIGNANINLKSKAINFEEQQHIDPLLPHQKVFEYKWIFENLPKVNYQHYAPSILDFTPQIAITASNIKLQSFVGNTDTWQSLGFFFSEINKDKDSLSIEQQQKIRLLINEKQSDKEKIAILYKYMQSHCRYVLNSKGILSWQSIPASDVLNVGYGDCKGLSNLMKAMLKVAGIKSNLVLVNAGTEYLVKLDKTFPKNIFNHVILCVPIPQDTVWLECTASDFPAGYLGDFTQGRDVLLLTESGGKIGRTPAYKKETDFLERKLHLNLDFSKNEQIIIGESVYSGPLHDDLRNFLTTSSFSKQNDFIKERISFKNYEIKSCNYLVDSTPNVVPQIKENFKIDLKGIVNETEKRFLVNLPIMKFTPINIESNIKRTLPICFEDEYQYKYQYRIDFPINVELEVLPQSIKIDKPFASFYFMPKKEGKTLIIDISYVAKTGTFPATMYDEYMEFYQTASRFNKSLDLSFLKQ